MTAPCGPRHREGEQGRLGRVPPRCGEPGLARSAQGCGRWMQNGGLRCWRHWVPHWTLAFDRVAKPQLRHGEQKTSRSLKKKKNTTTTTKKTKHKRGKKTTLTTRAAHTHPDSRVPRGEMRSLAADLNDFAPGFLHRSVLSAVGGVPAPTSPLQSGPYHPPKANETLLGPGTSVPGLARGSSSCAFSPGCLSSPGLLGSPIARVPMRQ